MMKIRSNARETLDIQRSIYNLSDDLWLEYLLHEKEIPKKFLKIIPEMPSEKNTTPFHWCLWSYYTFASARLF